LQSWILWIQEEKGSLDLDLDLDLGFVCLSFWKICEWCWRRRKRVFD